MKREEGKKRVELNEETRTGRTREEGEENHETIGEAEAAAFHVAWHRLPLKSLLLFVSSSKIMIVCPRDLLLGGSPRRAVCMDVCVCTCVCARRPRGALRSFARPRVRSSGDGRGMIGTLEVYRD